MTSWGCSAKCCTRMSIRFSRILSNVSRAIRSTCHWPTLLTSAHHACLFAVVRSSPSPFCSLGQRTGMGGASVSERNKAVVRRLVDEVLNGGRLEVVDELYAPALAPEAKEWIA